MKSQCKRSKSQVGRVEPEQVDEALPRLVEWLEWLRREGKGGPSPSRAASILGCTRPMVNQLVRQGILERSVYDEDGYTIVVISQRSIDAAAESKKKTGCWTTPRAFAWRRVSIPAEEKRLVGARFVQVATPWRKKVQKMGEVKRTEVNLSTDEKLALINKLSPLGDRYTRETEVCCIHCDRVFQVYEAKIVQAHAHDVPSGMTPPQFWIQCKYWPVCNGTVMDWMPEDGKGNRLRGWDDYWKGYDDFLQSEAGKSLKGAKGKWKWKQQRKS